MRVGQSLMPSSATRWRLMCDVEPSKRCWRSWRNPLLMARATTSEATPAATPATEMPVMMPMKACLLFARKYRDAIKSSNLIAMFLVAIGVSAPVQNGVSTSRLYRAGGSYLSQRIWFHTFRNRTAFFGLINSMKAIRPSKCARKWGDASRFWDSGPRRTQFVSVAFS